MNWKMYSKCTLTLSKQHINPNHPKTRLVFESSNLKSESESESESRVTKVESESQVTSKNLRKKENLIHNYVKVQS